MYWLGNISKIHSQVNVLVQEMLNSLTGKFQNLSVLTTEVFFFPHTNYSEQQSRAWICSCSHSGLQADRLSQSSPRVSQVSLGICPANSRRKTEEILGGTFYGISPRIDTHHFCPYFIGQNSVTQPHLVARVAGNVV